MKKHSNSLVLNSSFTFHGGIHPADHKSISNSSASQNIEAPVRYRIPINQSSPISSEHQLQIIVEIGSKVLKGDALTAYSNQNDPFNVPVHAPCDGVVEKIELFNCGHKSNIPEMTIVIKPLDLADKNLQTMHQTKHQTNIQFDTTWNDRPVEHLLKQIRDAGIVGLGGATFPTHLKQVSKLDLNDDKNPATLIVNAMECEPYITCDDRLLREHSREVIEGALIVSKIVNCQTIIFAIEDNKPNAIQSLKDAISLNNRLDLKDKVSSKENSQVLISMVIAPTKYPSGGEKQLIQLVTGKELEKHQRPKNLNILVQNVATLFAVYQTILLKKNLTDRLVTITGDLVPMPGNYWISFGSPISHIINSLDIETEDLESVIIGGPLMGQKITALSIPTSKKVNCLIFNKKNSHDESSDCIRCGECETVCPMKLLPQQLYWFSKTEQLQSMQRLSLDDCIECGACDYVCPSKIPLVNYFRFAKSEIEHLSIREKASELAKQRFDNREKRLVRLKEERKLKQKKLINDRQKASENNSNDPDGKKAAILASLSRVKNKPGQ